MLVASILALPVSQYFVNKTRLKMYSLQTIKHSEADSEVLNRAIAIKQVAWPYPKESQFRWIRDNLCDDDVHVFLQKDDRDVAYLNIAWVDAFINGVKVNCAGVGNVCSKFMGGVW